MSKKPMESNGIKSIKDIRYMSNNDLFELFDEIDQSDQEKVNDETCPMCQSNNIIEDSAQGIVICSKCGQVISMILDRKPEWNNYEEDEVIGRCSMPTNPLLPQSSLGTTMNCWGMIKKLHDWSSIPYRERMLNEVLKEIRAKCQENNIKKCVEDDAQILFKNVSECKHQNGENKGKYIIIRGVNRRSLIAACIFDSCKRNEDARSPNEIAKIFGLRYADITKGCKTLHKLMNRLKMDVKSKLSSSNQFVDRFCKRLRIKKSFIDIAHKIATNATRLSIASDHTPPSIATASIMLMADLKGLSITKRSISNKFEVSEVTITKAHKKLKEYLPLLLSDEAVYIIEQDICAKRKQLLMPISEESEMDDTSFDDDDLDLEDKDNDKEILVDLTKRMNAVITFHVQLDKEMKLLDKRSDSIMHITAN